METTAIKVLKALNDYGPLDPSTIKKICGTAYTYKVLKKLQHYRMVECGWLCKITEKGRIALQLVEQQQRIKCTDVLCLSTMSNSATG
jgi:hypothetical protein